MKWFLIYVMIMGNGAESLPQVMESAHAQCEDRMEDMKDHVQEVAELYNTVLTYKYICMDEDKYNELMEAE